MKFLILTLFIALNAYASEWTELNIPNAKCADGKPYSILLQKKDSDKLLVEFMGGGACWDAKSCFKIGAIFPWMHRYPVINSYSIFTANYSNLNPFKEHSKVYFPYCTADVYVGRHISHYGGKTIYYYGRKNVELAFAYLIKNQLVNFSDVNNLVVYGASAGAISSLIYGKDIEALVSPNAQKTMIVDSPGLHFGPTFWDKFDSDMKADFKDSFNRVGLDVDFHDGAVSKKMAPVLARYSQWTMGFVIALKDHAMSTIFGNITPDEHKKLVLSKDGLPYIARDFKNVKFWIKDTPMHTFYLLRASAEMKGDNIAMPAIDFADELYSNHLF